MIEELLWGEHKVPGDGWFFLGAGHRSVWLRQRGMSWDVATSLNSDSASFENPVLQNDDPPEGESVQTTLTDLILDRFEIIPSLPDRPLVLGFDKTVSIAPGATIIIFALLPLWLRLQLTERVRLLDVPLVQLQSTWHGDPIEGRLCYSRTSILYQQADDVPQSPVWAVCKLTIKNSARNPISCENIPIPCEYISLHLGRQETDRSPWTQELSIVFEANDQIHVNVEDLPHGQEGFWPSRGGKGDGIIKKSIFMFTKVRNY